MNKVVFDAALAARRAAEAPGGGGGAAVGAAGSGGTYGGTQMIPLLEDFPVEAARPVPERVSPGNGAKRELRGLGGSLAVLPVRHPVAITTIPCVYRLPLPWL